MDYLIGTKSTEPSDRCYTPTSYNSIIQSQAKRCCFRPRYQAICECWRCKCILTVRLRFQVPLKKRDTRYQPTNLLGRPSAPRQPRTFRRTVVNMATRQPSYDRGKRIPFCRFTKAGPFSRYYHVHPNPLKISLLILRSTGLFWRTTIR